MDHSYQAERSVHFKCSSPSYWRQLTFGSALPSRCRDRDKACIHPLRWVHLRSVSRHVRCQIRETYRVWAATAYGARKVTLLNKPNPFMRGHGPSEINVYYLSICRSPFPHQAAILREQIDCWSFPNSTVRNRRRLINRCVWGPSWVVRDRSGSMV